MSRLERAENITKKSASVLDSASGVLLTVSTIAMGLEIANKHPEKAVRVGLTGVVFAASLKLSGTLFDRCSEIISIKAEKANDRYF